MFIWRGSCKAEISVENGVEHDSSSGSTPCWERSQTVATSCCCISFPSGTRCRRHRDLHRRSVIISASLHLWTISFGSCFLSLTPSERFNSGSYDNWVKILMTRLFTKCYRLLAYETQWLFFVNQLLIWKYLMMKVKSGRRGTWVSCVVFLADYFCLDWDHCGI